MAPILKNFDGFTALMKIMLQLDVDPRWDDEASPDVILKKEDAMVQTYRNIKCAYRNIINNSAVCCKKKKKKNVITHLVALSVHVHPSCSRGNKIDNK